ncbi:hypothetical protein GCM10027167_06060 [Nocardia heshunensis]
MEAFERRAEGQGSMELSKNVEKACDAGWMDPACRESLGFWFFRFWFFEFCLEKVMRAVRGPGSAG